jgi:hypothetical protein
MPPSILVEFGLEASASRGASAAVALQRGHGILAVPQGAGVLALPMVSKGALRKPSSNLSRYVDKVVQPPRLFAFWDLVVAGKTCRRRRRR